MNLAIALVIVFVFLAKAKVPQYPNAYHQQISLSSCPSPRIMGGPDTAPFVTATWHTTLEIKLKENTKEIEDQNDADVVVNKQGDASYKFCSGVIVNKRIILTSGHCLKNAEDNGWYIYFNFDGTTGYNGGARRLVTHHRIYEPYNTNPTPENDFGVVYINTPILFNSTVTKAELSLINAREFANSVWSDCQMAGTGEIFTQSICMPRPTKKYMKGFLVSSDCCKAALQHTDGAAFTADSLCYRSLDAMPCLGDSGAGLSCKNAANQRKIVGIHSGGQKCCKNNKLVITPREKRLSPINAVFDRWLTDRISQYDATFPN